LLACPTPCRLRATVAATRLQRRSRACPHRLLLRPGLRTGPGRGATGAPSWWQLGSHRPRRHPCALRRMVVRGDTRLPTGCSRDVLRRPGLRLPPGGHGVALQRSGRPGGRTAHRVSPRGGGSGDHPDPGPDHPGPLPPAQPARSSRVARTHQPRYVSISGAGAGDGSGMVEGDMTALPLVFEAPSRGKPPRHLADLDRDQRRAAVTELGEPAFRADQLARHYFGRLSTDAAAMTDLPAAARNRLGTALLPQLATPVRHVSCDNGTTRKTLWRATDGTLTESVLMRYPDRATVCISSQAGCGMACPFCATGQGGLTRNLSTAELVEQVRSAAATLRDEWRDRLSNIVFMGMGEPLANYARVLAAVRRITGPAEKGAGFGISARSVTVS